MLDDVLYYLNSKKIHLGSDLVLLGQTVEGRKDYFTRKVRMIPVSYTHLDVYKRQDLFRLGFVKGSYIPCKDIRILREYTRYRYKLVSCRSSEKNRYQNALTVCNVALDSVVSNIFGKSSTSIIDYLLEQSGTSINHEEIASKLLRSLKSKEDAVIEPIEGYQMTDAQKYRMRLVRTHMDYITAEINDVDSIYFPLSLKIHFQIFFIRITDDAFPIELMNDCLIY